MKLSHIFISFAALVEMSGSSWLTPRRGANKPTADYTLLFDGKTLDGWIYDPIYWRVEDDKLVGEVTTANLLKRNSFIIKKDFVAGDFELKVEYRVSAQGNSGINYRSEIVDSLPYTLRGYQADIDGKNKYTGQNYEERKRTTLAYRGQKVIIADATGDTADLKDYIKNNAWTKAKIVDSLGVGEILKSSIDTGWNEYHLTVKGNHMLHYVNNVLMSDVTDNDSRYRSLKGYIGVQVHVGPPMKIEYRRFMIKEL